MGYSNGKFPLSIFVQVAPQHFFPHGMLARWRKLVALVLARHRVLLIITPGWNVYRPLDVQVQYRKDLGIYAAVPGFSTHGGVVSEREVFAVDVQNWGVIGWAAFSAAARECGFAVDVVRPQELWHICDYAPWVAPASLDATPLPIAQPKEDNMPIQIRRQSDGLIAQVGPDYFANMPDEATAEINRKVWSIADERHDLSDADFYRVTDSLGIPRTAIQPRTFWSRQLENELQLDRIQASLAEQKA